jgi:hypothetical protein
VSYLSSLRQAVLMFSQPQILQVSPVASSAFFGRSHPREDILFDDDPTRVSGCIQFLDYRWEIYAASAQLAEDAVPDRLEIIPTSLARLSGDPWIVVFEMNVPDARRVFAQSRNCISTAEGVVPGIKT